MFMEKIDLPRVTCDLFGITKGFDGNGGSAVDRGTKPRTANEAEARAYADFIRRKNGLPELGTPELQHAGGRIWRGQGVHFHYVGATYGAEISRGEYEPGAFSVLFPGANQMRATATLETLGDDGEAISSQTMPVEPKKGGLVWSKDDVRKACGPIAKVKAARKAPVVAKRRAVPTVGGRAKRTEAQRRAILRAWQMRAAMRRMRAEACEAPGAVPAEVMADIDEAGRLIRCADYVAPIAVQSKRTHAYERAVRRAWAERRAARDYRALFLMQRDARNAADDAAKGLAYDLDRARAAREQVEAEALRVSEICRERDAQLAAASDQRRLAEQIAEDHLRMREELQHALRATEARLAAAETENAQLWGEIEGLTAPAPALAA